MARQRSSSTSLPRWVKIFAAIGVVAVVVLAVMIASGHGPWQHMQHAAMS